jgi:hypothetical protein
VGYISLASAYISLALPTSLYIRISIYLQIVSAKLVFLHVSGDYLICIGTNQSGSGRSGEGSVLH